MWSIKQSVEFQDWFDESEDWLQEDILKNVEILRQFGPNLGRPKVDTIKGGNLKNLKELRVSSGVAVIRIFFVFDPDRTAVLLIGGDKSGSGGKVFYDKMIDKCEKIYLRYLSRKNIEIKKEERNLSTIAKKSRTRKNKKGGASEKEDKKI